MPFLPHGVFVKIKKKKRELTRKRFLYCKFLCSGSEQLKTRKNNHLFEDTGKLLNSPAVPGCKNKGKLIEGNQHFAGWFLSSFELEAENQDRLLANSKD